MERERMSIANICRCKRVENRGIFLPTAFVSAVTAFRFRGDGHGFRQRSLLRVCGVAGACFPMESVRGKGLKGQKGAIA